jgi:hypothetical protein
MDEAHGDQDMKRCQGVRAAVATLGLVGELLGRRDGVLLDGLKLVCKRPFTLWYAGGVSYP